MSTLSIDVTQITLSSLAVNSTQLVGGLQSVQGTQAGTQAIDTAGDRDGSGASATSPHISREAQFISNLQQLQQQEPAKFKQVLTDAANQLTAAAQSATGSDKQFLTNLADKFQKAANGDLSALQPSQPQTNPSAQTGPSSQALAAYAQNAQTPDLSALTQASGTSATGGHHHHHHHLSSSTQQEIGR